MESSASGLNIYRFGFLVVHSAVRCNCQRRYVGVLIVHHVLEGLGQLWVWMLKNCKSQTCQIQGLLFTLWSWLSLHVDVTWSVSVDTFPISILSSIEWGDGETRKIPQTKDTLRAKKNGAKRTKKLRTSTQKRKCQQKKISPHSVQLWKQSQRG